MTDDKKELEKKTITLRLFMVGEEKGTHKDTGAALYNVHFEPLTMSHDEYKEYKLKQLDSKDGGVEVRLV